jgi:hypothetical protein
MNPQSLFPPTPDKIIEGMQVMFDSGVTLGTQIATLVFNFVTTTFKFIVGG